MADGWVFSDHHDDFYIFQNQNLFQSFLCNIKPDMKITQAIQQVTSVIFLPEESIVAAAVTNGSINVPPQVTCAFKQD